MISKKALEMVKNHKSLVILIAVVIFAACASNQFFTMDNIQNLFLQVSIQGIISFGMTFTLIAGEFDMSVGSNLTLCGILFAQLLATMGLGAAILIVLLVAAAVFAGVRALRRAGGRWRFFRQQAAAYRQRRRKASGGKE